MAEDLVDKVVDEVDSVEPKVEAKPKFSIVKQPSTAWIVTRDGEAIDVEFMAFIVVMDGGTPHFALSLKTGGQDFFFGDEPAQGKTVQDAEILYDIQTDQYWIIGDGPAKFWVFTPVYNSPDIKQREVLGFQQVFMVVRFDVVMHKQNSDGRFVVSVMTMDNSAPGRSPWSRFEEQVRRRLRGMPDFEPPPAKRDRYSMLTRKKGTEDGQRAADADRPA